MPSIERDTFVWRLETRSDGIDDLLEPAWYPFPVVDLPEGIDRRQVDRAVAGIRSYNAVAVVGAGISASRYPMTSDLPPLLWHAIDAVPEARELLTARTGLQGTAKQILGSDPEKLAIGWQLVRVRPSVRRGFQQAFQRLDLDREPTPAHENLARLIYAGHVDMVISFNWDTALERAYQAIYGVPLPVDGIKYVKPHGDAANPEVDWILPDEAGVISEPLQARMRQLSDDRPRVLVVVGYSKSDEHVVQLLLGPLEAAWPVVNIGPTASGEDALTGTADGATSALVSALNARPDAQAWRFVTYARIRDLSAALRGYRLGPQDVAACPSVPAVDRLDSRLRTAKFARLTGDSGCGKSLAAFQAGQRLNARGWAVVELAERARPIAEIVGEFRALSGPVLAIVDDAQTLAPGAITELERSCSDDHAVLLVTTERVAGSDEEHISAKSAVAFLAEYCESNADLVLPLVEELDDRVGQSLFKETLQQRITVARRSDFPWQFMYLLGGGEQRFQSNLDNLSGDSPESAALFGIIAIHQLVSLDGGISLEGLATAAKKLGLTAHNVATGLANARRERLVIEKQGTIRTNHLRLADYALPYLCQRSRGEEAEKLLAYIGGLLESTENSARGMVWLVDAFMFKKAVDRVDIGIIFNPAIASKVVDFALRINAGAERGSAAYLLWQLGYSGCLDKNELDKIAEVLPQWVESMTSDDVYGIRYLLMHLRGADKEMFGRVINQTSPETLARLITENATVRTAGVWADAVGELSFPPGTDQDDWWTRFEVALDTTVLVCRLREDDHEGVGGIPDLFDALMHTAPNAARDVLAGIRERLSTSFESRLASTAAACTSLMFGVVGAMADDEAAIAISEDERVDWAGIRRDFVSLLEAVDWERAAASLQSVELYELHNFELFLRWLSQLNSSAVDRLINAMRDDWLEHICSGHWNDTADIARFLWGLCQGSSDSRAREIIERHIHEIGNFDQFLLEPLPDIAIRILQNGGVALLPVRSGFGWRECALCVDKMAELDVDMARRSINQTTGELVEALALRQSDMTPGLDGFLQALDRVSPGAVETLLGGVELAVAEEHWRARAAGSPAEVAEARALFERAAKTSLPVSEFARELLNTTVQG